MWLSLCEIQLGFRKKFKTNIRQSCDTRITSQVSSSALWHYKQIISSRCQRFKLIYDIGNNFPCSDPHIDKQIADTHKKSMPKHHWREPFKSFLGRQIDDEKAVELRGTKEEIEGKVQTILDILKEDDNDEKESLAKVIQDIHNHYQSLYESYDHLTKELRNKAQGKHGKDSSSSSSDSSDSDDSPRKNGKVDDKIVNSSAEIKQELEMANLEVGELKNKLAVTIAEKEELYLEYQNALRNIQELENARIIHAEQNQKLEDMDRERESLIFEKKAIIVTFEEEKRSAEELRAINSQLQQDKATLLLELEAGENEIAKLIQVQKTAEEENTMLSLHSSRLEDEIKQAEKKIQDLVTESCHLSEKVADKERELSSHLEIHEAHKEEASTRMKDLKVNLDMSHTQRREIEKQKDDELSVLLKKISDLEKTLAEREDELISIQEKLEDVQIEASTQIAALTEHVYSFQQQLELQQFEKTQLEVQIKRGKLESTENLSLVENINTELVNKVIQEEIKLKEKENAFIKLSEEHKQLELQYQNLEESLKSSQKKIKEMTEQLHKDRDKDNQEHIQLEETVEDLRGDLEMKDDEISTLKEIMRNTEVKHRLTRQKLHITEQLLAEKEEIQLSKEMKLREEHKLLEERFTILSGIVTAYKEAQVKIITEVSEKVNDTLTGIDTFNMKFEEDYGHLETRIYEFVNELKLTRNWITETNAEKYQLKKESTSLLQQLKDKNEQNVLMSVKIGEMETKLKNHKDEREILIQTVKMWEGKLGELEKVIEERDEKMGELERKMNEKDNGLLSLSEEKREAIRQLCVWIDYHRNRYNDLKDMISKTIGGRRPVAT